MLTGQPAPHLRTYVSSYQGYDEFVPAGRRMQVPHPDVVFIIGLGNPIRVVDPRQRADWTTDRTVFVAGVHDSYVFTESPLPTRGIQVNLTAIGAYLFFGVAMDSLANRVVDLGDIFGAAGRRLILELGEATTWQACFDILDRAIAARIAAAHPPSEAVTWAWTTLLRTGGRAGIGALAKEIGWSQKHLIARFREQIGVPPKTFARVVRFDRAVKSLRQQAEPHFADVASDLGYYDQAHLRSGAPHPRLQRICRRNTGRVSRGPVKFFQDGLGAGRVSCGHEAKHLSDSPLPRCAGRDRLVVPGVRVRVAARSARSERNRHPQPADAWRRRRGRLVGHTRRWEESMVGCRSDDLCMHSRSRRASRARQRGRRADRDSSS
jgi:AraC-like DNA-binding protein